MADMDLVYSKVLAGDVHAFYVTKEWKEKRQEVLLRDNYICQRCLGKWNQQGIDPVKKIKLSSAKIVHHIKPMKDYFNKALDNDNLISLCFECHEKVEGRTNNKFKIKKEPLTIEQW